jgi:2,3-bisphosphoglycerate-independent phosphoglycerate mutase
LIYVDRIEAVLAEITAAGKTARFASGGGRMVTTMDRYEADWAIVERGWNAHVHGDARRFASAREAVETFRSEDPKVGDQNLPAFVVAEDGEPVGRIADGDAVVCFNFRGDRVIEISRAFEEDDLPHFDRGKRPDVLYAGIMEYDGDTHVPSKYLVEPPDIDRTMGEFLVHNKTSQLAISETQKYGHVTYFWNGNRSGMFDPALETYVEIPSDRAPFEQRPWMKAAEITDALIEQLTTKQPRHARVNYANGDMVGHTGHLEAAVLAVQTVDVCLARVLPVIDALQGALIVTADHGNADEMFERDKQGFARDAKGRLCPKTSHTLNAVPFYVHGAAVPGLRIDPSVARPTLANVAATVLQLMGYERPEGYAPGLLQP